MKIYIAGPDVFEPDAVMIGEHKKALCALYGHEGLYPLDNECDAAAEIYKGNLALIDKADVIIADGNDFRGETDAGTAFEVGYGAAKGKRIFLYTADSRTLREKYGKTDEKGRAVEDFGYPFNLMLAEAAQIVIGDFEDCLKMLNAE